jgi:short-chain Z-isoprenyl diphosphate synthase
LQLSSNGQGFDEKVIFTVGYILMTKNFLALWETLNKPLYWFYEQQLLSEVKKNTKLPHHIGIIMDGNRRFAKAIGLDSKTGHDYGAGKARDVLDWCLELDIKHVTIWGFSSDNASRKPEEVAHLLSLIAREAKALVSDVRLHHHKVRVKVIGNIEDFPSSTKEALSEIEKATESYQGMLLNLALGYGGREEIADAVRKFLHRHADTHEVHELIDQVTPEVISNYLYTAGIPDPDFVIRTSGEVRLSGFLLWQTAYSEFYFCDAYWPSFRKVDFLRALRSFQERERRFGK